MPYNRHAAACKGVVTTVGTMSCQSPHVNDIDAHRPHRFQVAAGNSIVLGSDFAARWQVQGNEHHTHMTED